MHRLFARQLAKAQGPGGAIDLARLGELVSRAYHKWENDRRRIADHASALNARETELDAQNQRFHAAINATGQALLMYDADGRLMICNDRYYEMYGLERNAIRPGASVLEVLQRLAEANVLNGDPEVLSAEILAAAASGRARGWVLELADERTVSVTVRPTANGGWVTTHEDITQKRDAERRLAYMTRHDMLTALPNRTHLRERLADELQRIHPGEQLAVLYLDIDRFKAVNDTIGHAAGDTFLQAFAERLLHAVDPRDFVARIGGDEFAIIHTTNRQPAARTAALATRLCDLAGTPERVNDQSIAATGVSIGIACAPGDGIDADALIRNAYIALGRAKESGRGSFRFFEPEMDARMKARRSMEAALRAALAQGEFRLDYQPVINLRHGMVTCCEALLRWEWAGHGEIEPGVFVPMAEELGLIAPIGEWVLHQACRDARGWPSDVRVAINLSPIQLQSPKLVEMVVEALTTGDLDAARLEIEITESVLMQDTEASLKALHRLHDLGIRISMDDFGTGYSSLIGLRSFPFDKIKIDRSFIAGLPQDADSTAIVRAVASLAKSLGMITTAEGVETVAQMELVRSLGVTEMQGFHFSRPRPIEHINQLLSPLRARATRYA